MYRVGEASVWEGGTMIDGGEHFSEGEMGGGGGNFCWRVKLPGLPSFE